MKNNNPTLDIVKGIAIILVVYGHVIEHSLAPWTSHEFFLIPIVKIIYTFHMPVFFFISGYLMANSLKNHDLLDVFKSRVRSLLVPFLTLVILGVVMTYILNLIFGYDLGRVNVVGDLADQLLLKPQIWFLFTLFVLSCLLILSVGLEKRWGAGIFAFIYLLIMIIPLNNSCAIYYVKWFYLFFAGGYFINKYNIKMPDSSVQKLAGLLSLILFCLFVACWTTNDYIYINKMNFMSQHYFYEIARIIYRYFMGFLGITIVFYMGANLLKGRIASFIGEIGAYSLDIYIIQMFILEGIYPRLIYKAQIHLDFNSPYILYFVAPLITTLFVALCMLSSKLLIRRNPILNKFLLGGRSIT